jgi:hypothetical protein
MYTVYSLRKNGYRVWVRHERPKYYDRKTNRELFYEHGGKTIVEVRDRKTDSLIGTGEATCSKRDNYNKKLGVQIALGRVFSKVTV